MSTRRIVTLLAATAVVVGLAGTPAGAATPPSQYAQNSDYCLGQCNDIMPPGEYGNASLLGHRTPTTNSARTASCSQNTARSPRTS